MTYRPTPHAQRGAVLIVGLIILMLLTVLVTAAFKFSDTNLKSVSNMQMRNEAIAAANISIEQAMDLWTFDELPTLEPFDIDIDRNGTTDYVVTVDSLTCVGAIPMRTEGDRGSEPLLDLDGSIKPGGSAAAKSVFTVTWDVQMTAKAASSGAKVEMHQGVSRTISEDKCTAACPPGPGLSCGV